MRATRVKWMGAALISFSLLAAACSDDATTSTTDATASAGGSEGDIFVTGSSTVAPISSLVADNFAIAGSPASVTVDNPGTGDGFAAFCAGEADISDASRPIKQEEADACAEAGIDFIELEVAFDGLTVMTSPANDAVECLTTADLYALVGPESEGFDNWSDGQEIATALGSATVLPDAPLDITAPGQESGTYDAFIELALGDPTDARVEAGAITDDQAGTTRTDYSSQADDNAIISGIEGSDTSFGWVGFAFAQGAGDQVKELEVDAGDGCVAPSDETIADGSYPLSRSLFIYVSAASLADNPAVEEYVDFYLTQLDVAVTEAGYVPLPTERVDATQTTWDSKTTGSTLLEG